ncbi:membrane-bound lytic murein transglycosylase D [Bordetella ansorpii]|uniref:Membrane-bound lytic murein transglycosylase D n=1 Tax=Bordetella ansorpii TaxID=288768 RepID=A0A157QJE4_9BORD|nr:LysM peptidoglycan-binding domain-containing protein [Bordetella ansorpii]SAI45887.1 membrane-bound lytic murein transglycosylase D [Bordetella ansorpii]
MSLTRLFIPLLLAMLAGCAGTSPTKPEQTAATEAAAKQQAQRIDRYLARDTSRTVDLTHPPRDAWDRIRRGFAIPNLNTDLSQQWTDYYASHPEAVQRMAQRAGKYLYYIVDEINRRGLPTELALLPFVESAYNPTALSHAQASGLWQFVPATGTHYNLKQDWWRDERRDPIASTNAALDYLEYLFEMQGDWYLALASYNWGEGSVQRAMGKNENAGRPTDYLSLDMPDETRNYVPKLQAIKNIISNPQKYAVVLPPVGNTPYFTAVSKHRDIDIEVAAKLAEMPLDEFKALNPSFKQPMIRGEHAATLLLPADRVDVFNANLASYKGKLSAWSVYQVRRGETLASVAKRVGVPQARLRAANELPRRAKLAAGQNLLIPVSGAEGGVQLASLSPAPASALESAPAVVSPRARTRGAQPNVRTHKVRSGDTLYSIARNYGTSVDTLRALNNLKGSNLKIGSQLRIPGTDTRG